MYIKREFLGIHNLNFNYFYIFFLKLLFEFAIVLTVHFSIDVFIKLSG